MLGFGSKDVPANVRKAGLTKWYDGLSDQDKVKLGRYLENADTSSESAFFVSVINSADEDHNYRFVSSVYDGIAAVKMSPPDRYDVINSAILGFYNNEDYDRCLALCDEGLELLKDKAVWDHVLKAGNGQLPEDVNCRNYKLNIVVGVKYDYDAGDALLDQFEKDGLISHEDVQYRKNSIKTFRMQRTFDNIFNIRPKDQ